MDSSSEPQPMKTKSDVGMVIQEVDDDRAEYATAPNSAKGFRFWMIFVAICVAMFMSALEFVSISSALPTIVHDLHGQDFVWVASAYALASTALLPASGAMAEVFGRRTTMLGALALFAIGSALCGAAQNMNWLIAARTVQGAGGGGILALGSIILSDLVSLKERGLYNGILGLAWASAGGLGPLIGGALATEGQWRWLFYLNLPLSGLAAGLVLVFLKLKTPRGNFQERFSRMDWGGNVIMIASSIACIIGLTWGGVKFPWTSAQVLVPLILGLLGMCGFLVYEALVAKNPVVPYTLLSNRTSLSGFIQTFLNPVVAVSFIYFLPTYYQACKGATPVRGGVELLAVCMAIGPTLVVIGGSIQATKRYRIQMWIGWALLMLAAGLLSTVDAETPSARVVGFSIIAGVGMGVLYASTYFPVLAPLPVSENAHALAFFAFCRSFALIWGVTIGTAVLQTQLTKRLPPDFVALFPDGVSIAYSSIPAINGLDDPLRTQVRAAFAQSIAVIWKVNIGIAGLGLLSSLAMKGLPLHTDIDEKWGLEDKASNGTHERISELPLMDR